MKNGKIIHKQCKKPTCPINVSALYLKNNRVVWFVFRGRLYTFQFYSIQETCDSCLSRDRYLK